MRQLRILRDGARYHVSARANRQELRLEPQKAKALFLSIVTEAKTKYRFRIENFCVMGNHFHLIIKPALGESLSMIMKWILQVFAVRYNKQNGLTGHFWGDRFYSRILHDRAQFCHAFEYLNHNPVEAGLARFPRAWPFGGLWHFFHGRWDVLDKDMPRWLRRAFENSS